MEASKEGEMPSEPAPETLPTEAAEGPKRTKLLAVIIAVIIVVAAIGAAIGLGLFGGDEDENLPPTAGARPMTGTTVDIGGYVVIESTATDPDGEIVNYTWYFGDGTHVSGEDLSTVNHTYQYGGSYLVLLIVTDDEDATATNAASMVRVNVRYYDPGELAAWDNTTAPFALLSSDKDVIANNTLVTFNMTGSYGIVWNATAVDFDSGWGNISEMTLDYADGSAVATITPAEYMTATHTFTAPGHYAAKLTVTGDNDESTIVIRTIHVLSPEAPTPGTIKNPDAFIEVTIGEPDYLDPAVDYETAGGEILQNVYETLVWYDRDSVVTLKPALATEVPSFTNGGISADGMNYTFNLRAGVKFHNNATMTADDVVYSIQRVLRIHDPDGPSWMLEQVMTDYLSYSVGDVLANFTSSAAWVMDAIGGTNPAYIITELDVQNVSEAVVLKVDGDTVTFRLTHPYPAFLAIAAYTVMSVVSKEYVEDNGGVTNGDHNAHMDQNTCGTGPYKLVSWEHGSKIHLTRNDAYWSTKPTLKDAYVIKANDVNTRILMLQAGDADTGYVPIEYENQFQGAAFDITKGLPTFDMMFVGMNMNIDTTEAATFGSTVPADFFADKNVRKAFVHLMNVSKFIENVMKSNAIQPNGPIPKGMFGYNASAPLYEYNLTLAQQFLEAAESTIPGHSWWQDGFTVAFIYNAGNVYRETACQYMKDALEGLGTQFHAEVHALDWPAYLAAVRASPSPLPMFFLGWGPDYADPDDYVNPFLYSYGSFPYRTGYSNASIDALIESAAAELNSTLRFQMYEELTELCYDDAPYIWMYQANNFHVERSWLNGYYFNPMYGGFYFPAFSKG